MEDFIFETEYNFFIEKEKSFQEHCKNYDIK